MSWNIQTEGLFVRQGSFEGMLVVLTQYEEKYAER